jgi:hypothetical protein
LPYLTLMKIVDLSNSETTEPLIFPIDTDVGLLEKGHLGAIKAGLIKFIDTSLAATPRELTLDGRTRRAALLTGGLLPTVSVFDMDILYSSTSSPINRDRQIIASTELDLSHLAVLCSRNGLTVVAPARLANSSSPVLTLDSEGLAGVYLGRQPCGNVSFRDGSYVLCSVQSAVRTMFSAKRNHEHTLTRSKFFLKPQANTIFPAWQRFHTISPNPGR